MRRALLLALLLAIAAPLQAQVIGGGGVIPGGGGFRVSGTAAVGALLCGAGGTAFTRIADVTTGQVFVSGGVDACPAWSPSPTVTSVLHGDGSPGAPSVTFANGLTEGAYRIGTSSFGLAANGAGQLAVFGNGVYIRSDGSFGWSQNSALNGVQDLSLFRDAANTLAQRNGTNAQTFRVYNTSTDASNYERGEMQWVGNSLNIGTFNAGTGSARTLGFITGATGRWNINGATGHFLATTDNTYDIGAAGATRPRDYYGAGNITAGGTVTSGAGTTAIPSQFVTHGTLLTTATADAIENDATAFYNTIDTTNGRRYTDGWNYFRLTGSGSGITTIADFFGSSDGIPLVANGVYEIEWHCYFSQATAGIATWTIVTATTALATLTGEYVGSNIAGVGTVGAPQTAAINTTASSSTAFPVTGTEATGVTHEFTIRVLLTAGNGASNTRLRLAMSAGTATPLINSYYRVRRLPGGNTGTFVS